jgi:hypothetical protein
MATFTIHRKDNKWVGTDDQGQVIRPVLVRYQMDTIPQVIAHLLGGTFDGSTIVGGRVPLAATKWQASTALRLSGLITPEAVQATIDAIQDGATHAAADDAWNRADEIRRDHPLIAMLGALLGLTSEQLDALFRLAVVQGY